MKKKGLRKKKRNRNQLLYYFVVIYVTCASVWWGYLLYEKNEELFLEREKALKAELFSTGEASNLETFYERPEYGVILAKHNRQKWMIIGEGIVFLILLLVGLWLVNRSLRKEVFLAKQQRNFLLSITHELKSPIASIRLAFDTFLKRKNLKPEQIGKLSRNAIKETERLHTLVNNILLAARLDAHFHLSMGALNLKTLLEGLVVQLREKYPNTRFAFSVEQDLPNIQGDRMGLTSVILNLLENAVKYCPKGSEIKIFLRQQEQNLVMEIADEGEGIPDSEKERIFEKFYRIGNEDTRKTKGTGLGLFIVKSIVDAHKGTIMVKDNQPNGAIFQIMLPILN